MQPNAVFDIFLTDLWKCLNYHLQNIIIVKKMGNPFGNRFRGHLIMTSTGREDDGGHKKIKTKTADGCRCLKKRVGG